MKARRSSRNPSGCPTRPSKDIPGTPAARPSKGIPDIPNIPVIHDIPASPGISTSSSISRESTHSSILRLECIFYIFYNFYSLIGFHRNSTEYQLDNTNYKHYILQRKGDVVISVKIDIFSRIEIFPSIVLSSEKTNCKNDIQ